MSGDEVLVLLLSGVVGLVGWALLALGLGRADPLLLRLRARQALLGVLVLCAAGLLAVLLTLASHDVRDDGRYLAFYLLMGLAWLRAAAALLPWLGLSLRDDVVERGNPAALPAACGWLAGHAAAFAGGNVGDGPGWWVVVACGALSSGAVAAAWLLLDRAAGVAEAVAVERDVASGWRLGGALLATGLLAGRAVAGDWVSGDALLRDFASVGWPLLPLLLLAAAVQRFAGPRPDAGPRSTLATGVLPALGYVGWAVLMVVLAGWPG